MTRKIHTPGPWKVQTWQHDDEIAPRYSIISETEMSPIESDTGAAVISGEWYDCPQDWANAALMAAAPEMLDVLESICASHNEQVPVGASTNTAVSLKLIRRARDVIAKALDNGSELLEDAGVVKTLDSNG